MVLNFIILFWYLTFLIIAYSGISGLKPLSTESTLIFLSFLLFFFIGQLTSKIITNKKYTRNRYSFKHKNTDAIILLFLTFYLIYSLLVILNVYFIHDINIVSYRNAFFDGSKENLKYFGGWYIYYTHFLATVSVLAILPFYVGTKKIKIQIIILLCIISYDVIFLSRTGVYYFVIALLCGFIIRKVRLRKIIIPIGATIVLILIFSIYRESELDITQIIKNTIINYHTAPYILFNDNIIEHNNINYTGTGYASLGIYNFILYILDNNIIAQINDLKQQLGVFYNLSNDDHIYIPYNAYYTSLGLVYMDFGYIGCIIVSYFSGLTLSLVNLLSKSIKPIEPIAIFYSSICMLSLLSPITLNIFAFVIVVFIILFPFYYRSWIRL